YGASLCSIKMSRFLWEEVTLAAGLGPRTHVHCVADGSDPIFALFQEQFGTDEKKAKFTVDFFHVSDYLGQAGEVIAPGQANEEWMHQQKGLLLENKPGQVLQRLEKKFEPLDQDRTRVRRGHAYIEKRIAHLAQAGARA